MQLSASSAGSRVLMDAPLPLSAVRARSEPPMDRLAADTCPPRARRTCRAPTWSARPSRPRPPSRSQRRRCT
eukprot:2963611-Prymnesium_polylepis.1